MRIIILTIVLFTFLIIEAKAQSFIEMPSIFSDNMVLQQNSDAPVWGKASPGIDIMVRASWGATAKAKVQNDSSWILSLKTPKAGGPYEVNVKVGDSLISYKNVMTGEVWVCSGQSNMEMPLEGWPPKDTIFTGKEEIKKAANPNIRIFTVSRAFASEKQFNCSGRWFVSSPETAAKFSATAYFFGKKLNKELNVPVGLINTSWGGTPIESWISKDSLYTIGEFRSALDKLAQSREEIVKLNNWIKSFPTVDIKEKDVQNRWKALDFQDSLCPGMDYDDTRWLDMNLPVAWENTDLGNFDGAGWFRKKVTIPSNWKSKDLVLELGPIDDMDETYVNGVKVGGIMEDGNWQTERKYTVSGSIVRDSILVIAVRVLDNQGGGGIYGKKEQMVLHPKDSLGLDESISLAGIWKFLPVAEFRDMKFYVFGAKGEQYFMRPKLQVDLSAYVPAALYNGMIAPLIPYSIKGAIWYQGESNTGNPELYKKLFPMMINNWRKDWQTGEFPFYYVQIAPYNYGGQIHSERLREAQLFTLSTPKTGMAVTMDIGNVNNIHPGNKKAVGERLALWALAKDYHKKVLYSGPVYKSMKIKNGKVILSFDYADGGLVIKEINGESNFLIAGKDGVFNKAEVKTDGRKLIVSSPMVKEPLYVRYAWTNVAEAALFNKSGLPAPSFRTDKLEEEKLASSK